jgi:hypothetical protein
VSGVGAPDMVSIVYEGSRKLSFFVFLKMKVVAIFKIYNSSTTSSYFFFVRAETMEERGNTNEWMLLM